jgi:copper homeostasis protein
MSLVIELCVEGVDGAATAASAGADRIELCASLMEGGITPSLGTLQATLAAVDVPVMVMVRPRGGDFLYSDREFASMLADVALFRQAGAAGVVFGCLNPDGTVDEARTRALVAAAGPLACTFHRAFDMTADPSAALEALIRCGIGRVLTSGQAPTAMQGHERLAALVRQSAGRIAVMGCGALRADNIAAIRHRTGLTELHFSAQISIPSGMTHRNTALAMGSAGEAREFIHVGTDPDAVRATIAAARA